MPAVICVVAPISKSQVRNAALVHLSKHRSDRDSSRSTQSALVRHRLFGGVCLGLSLDEPSGGLAPAIIGDLVDALCEIRRRGLTLLVVEQNLELAEAIADRCVVMSAGVLRWAGPMENAIANEAIREAYFA